MKDITFTISAKRLRRECAWIAAAFVAANAFNAYAIVTRKTAWSELVTCLPFVLGLAAFFYAATGVVRLAACGVAWLWRKARKPAGRDVARSHTSPE